jgi:hypothetical protein
MTILSAPFRWYGNMFLRVTHAISRAQEFAADRLAATTIGSEPLVEGLRTIHRASGACEYYLSNEVLPVVRNGFRPPLVEGFAKLLNTEYIAKSIDETLDIELKWAEQGVYDTHPPLAQRIAAVQGLLRRRVQHDAPALTLIENLPELEAQLIASWLGNGAPLLKPISWEETGPKVLLPGWQDLAKRSAHALEGIALKDLYGVASKIDPFARKLDVPPSGAPREVLVDYAVSALGAAFACALHRSGWEVDSAPGKFQMVSSERHLNPFHVVRQILSGELKEPDWNQTTADLGLDPMMRLANSA